jgi:hypothetical protein
MREDFNVALLVAVISKLTWQSSTSDTVPTHQRDQPKQGASTFERTQRFISQIAT